MLHCCPFCDASPISVSSLARCKLGHTYCDGCALVLMLGGGEDGPLPEEDSSVFCPMCVQPPTEFVCPITHELMETPVVAQDGFTYEKSAIEDWMKCKKTSPKTNMPIEAVLVPNFNLKALIAEWRLKHCGSGGRQ
jgi:hypothetical protein